MNSINRSYKQADPASPQRVAELRLTISPEASRMLIISLGVVVAAIALYSAALIYYAPTQLSRLPGNAIALLVVFATYGPLRRGDGRAAINIVSHGAFLYIASAALIGGGLTSAILIALPLVIVIPGLLLGRNAAKRFTILSVGLCLALLLAHLLQLIPKVPSLPPVFIAVTVLVVLFIACVMALFAADAHAQRLLRVQQLNDKLLISQQEFRTLADNLPALVMRADLNLVCTYVNQPLLDFAGLCETDLVGQPLEAIFSANQFSMVPTAVQAALAGERVTFLAPHGHGEDQRIFELVMVADADQADIPVGFLAVFYDVTDRERLNVELRKAATHDYLTGIANRMQVDDQLQSALARASRHKKQVALMVFDLDGFKQINDQHGHAAGDLILKHVASQLKATVRSMDTVGRIGGDEFVVVLEGLEQVEHACSLAGKLLGAVRESILCGEQQLSVGASIGVALYPLHGETPRELFQRADAAMYLAKGAGKNSFRLANE